MSQITTNNLSRLTELSNKEKQVIYGGTAADSAAATSSTATAASISSTYGVVLTISRIHTNSYYKYWYGYLSRL